jgi:hypothetical protein
VFKNKFKPNGTINKYKVYLVAKGYKQMWHVDYFDTKFFDYYNLSIRILFAIASIFKLVVHKMDVKIVL